MSGSTFTPSTASPYVKSTFPSDQSSMQKYLDLELSKIAVATNTLKTAVVQLQGILSTAYNWTAKQWFTSAIDVVGGITSDTIILSSYVKLTPLATPPASPTAGMIYYDSGTNKHYGYNGSAWNALW